MKWAVDFLVPDGTLVLAARDGRVHELYLKSKKWGPTEELAGETNYITIEHQDGSGPIEYSQYCHVACPRWYRRQLVKQGSWVKAGQPISYVEKNGWTDRDHLHFMVFRLDCDTSNPFGFKSLQVTLR